MLRAAQIAARPERKLEALQGLSDCSSNVEQLLKEQTAWVAMARAQGASWSDVAGSMGVTRQAAQQRYAARQADLVEMTPAMFETGS